MSSPTYSISGVSPHMTLKPRISDANSVIIKLCFYCFLPRRSRSAGSGKPKGSGCSVIRGPYRMVLYASNCVRCSFLGKSAFRQLQTERKSARTRQIEKLFRARFILLRRW